MLEASSSFKKDNEIDLINFLLTLWYGKWTIIIFFIASLLFAIVISFNQQKLFVFSTPIQKGKLSTFIDYSIVNEVLDSNNIRYSISNDTIFETFIIEFNDYEEMAWALNKDEYVNETFKGLDERQKEEQIIKYASKFKLNYPKYQEQLPVYDRDWSMTFKWNNLNSGKHLFNEALMFTLDNVKNEIMSIINKLNESKKIQNETEIAYLTKSLDIIIDNQIDKDNKNIVYLSEQSSIAKEIEKEKKVLNELGGTRSEPFYERGYKAIDKEILIIKERSAEDSALMAEGYIATQERINLLKNDLSSLKLSKALNLLEDADPKNWISYNFINVQSRLDNKTWFIFVLSSVVGFIFGSIYVLFASILSKREDLLTDK